MSHFLWGSCNGLKNQCHVITHPDNTYIFKSTIIIRVLLFIMIIIYIFFLCIICYYKLMMQSNCFIQPSILKWCILKSWKNTVVLCSTSGWGICTLFLHYCECVWTIVSSVFWQNLIQHCSEVWVLTTAHREAFLTWMQPTISLAVKIIQLPLSTC